MTPLAEAQARLLANVQPVPAECAALENAAGRWLAEPLIALRSQPARDLSAMDGYAVRAADPGPWRLIGESAAGAQFRGTVAAGEAVRIFTGAVVPDGADTVIMQEYVRAAQSVISQTQSPALTLAVNVRIAGSDFNKGLTVIPPGTKLSAKHIGLAAMAGYGALPVRRKLVIALISTGDELIAPGAPAADDQIPSSNAPMLAALLTDWPAIISCYHAADKIGALSELLEAQNTADIIVTLGGASVGDHDLVRPAIEAAGGTIDVWKVAMRPGKPLIIGRLGAATVLGLPGNPVSAYVTAHLFLLPLIRALMGDPHPLPRPVKLRLGALLPANGARTDHVRARLVDGVIMPVPGQDSAGLLRLSEADGLIVRLPGAAPASTGDDVLFFFA